MRKIAFIVFMLLLSTAFAEDYVCINSMDGRDVLSGVFYANVKDLPVKFMPVPGGNADIFAAKVGGNHDILLIEGTMPVSSFVESNLVNRNNTVEVYTSSDGGVANLELARRSGADRFIVVDSAFSDGALSVLPYAAMTDSYVIMANKNNIDEVKDIVEDAEQLTIYGLVSSEVESELDEFDPVTIGKGEDKFEDNVDIVEKTMTEFNKDNVIMVQGTFIEEAMANGKQPILMSGKLVPQATYDFVKSKVRNDELTQVMLIGNELVVPIYDMREKMEQEFKDEGLNKTFGIVVKFAQVVPSADTGVLVLDTFPLPAYQPELEIKEIFYNDQNNKVMVSVDNVGEGPAYFSEEVRVKVDGEDYEILGTDEVSLIERGEQLGMEYDLDLSGVSEGNVTAMVLVKYGSSKKSLEQFISQEGPLTTVSYVDTSNVSVQSARYSSDQQVVRVTIRNNGDEAAYVFSKLNLVVGGSEATISGADVREIDAGSLIVEEFPLELTEEDVEANQNVSVMIDYGAREGFLLKKAEYIVPLEAGGDNMLLFLIMGAVALLALLAVAAYFLLGRKKPGKKKAS
ncbi:hypothetical protein GF318_01850 [Candidatus Micrarchaeota archaeon]|nr:hypothetical protein [Candidatus Micrarchaeota archaeon]